VSFVEPVSDTAVRLAGDVQTHRRACVLLNSHSGTLQRFGVEQTAHRITAACETNGIDATIAVVPGSSIAHALRRAVKRDGVRSGFDMVIVGGGDGTLSAAASVLAGGDLPLGILPLGTFNHFARDLEIPLELEAAIELIGRGHVQSVDVGEVNGRVFINNSSLGIYPHLVAVRDRVHRRGLTKWGAAGLAFVRVLWRLPRPKLRVRASAWKLEQRTPCLFIGNNRYHLDAFAVARRPRLVDGALWLYIANRHSRLALLELAVRAFLGRLDPVRDFTLTRIETVEVTSRRHRLRVALDGESVTVETPLHYRTLPRALRVIVPERIL
jgi:diacylglycerol kinase family enzyme